MKSFTRWILIFACALAAFSSAMAEEPVRLRILSYNIHHAEGIDRKLDINRIAKVIRSAKPDLVALQEVDQNVKRTQSVDQPAELAKLTQMQCLFGANIKLQGGHYGNAVLSRFPIKLAKNHHLPNIDEGEQRGVMEVLVTMPDSDNSLLFLATHFDHRSDERERLASATFINELVSKHPSKLAILAGDLNATPASKTLQIFRQQWKRANTEDLATVPVGKPKRQIDYVLYRPADRWKVIDTQVLDEAIASDHRAILAVLELNTHE